MYGILQIEKLSNFIHHHFVPPYNSKFPIMKTHLGLLLPVGSVKINCDALYCHKTKEACIAAIIRDCSDNILGGASKFITACSASAVEALACRLGISFVIRNARRM
ncbi:hypothetical protein V6N13_079708 [Hibiscus sabdariffa]